MTWVVKAGARLSLWEEESHCRRAAIPIAVWHMLTIDADYAELCGDHFARLHFELVMQRIVCQANVLGFAVRGSRW